jgi:hypothetical protein
LRGSGRAYFPAICCDSTIRVEIAVVEGNQRRRMVWLTEAGAMRLKDAMPVWRRAHKALAGARAPELAQRLAAASEAPGGFARNHRPDRLRQYEKGLLGPELAFTART